MFGGCVGEAVVELLVDVSLDGGDLFLLGGLEAKGCSKWFELEGGFILFFGRRWIGVERVGHAVVVLNEKVNLCPEIGL